MKAALLQLNSIWEAPRENHVRAAELIGIAADQGSDIALLPEMFPTGTSSNTGLTAEAANGPTETFLAEAARRHRLNLVAGYALRSEDRGGAARNVAAVFNRQGELVARYAKLHPFSLALEHRYYEPGQSCARFELEGAACGLFICYDLRFPEAFRSIAAGVQAIFVIANWPRSRIDHWDILLRARAIENQCFIIGVNRTGYDGNGLYYSGCSQIVDPWGTVVCRGSEHEHVVLGEFDPQEADRYRAKYAFLKDMKPKGFFDPSR